MEPIIKDGKYYTEGGVYLGDVKQENNVKQENIKQENNVKQEDNKNGLIIKDGNYYTEGGVNMGKVNTKQNEPKQNEPKQNIPKQNEPKQNVSLQNEPNRNVDIRKARPLNLDINDLNKTLNVLTNSGKSKEEAIATIKQKAIDKGFDVSSFDTQYSSLLNSYEGIDSDVNGLLKQISEGVNINTYVKQNNPNYKVADKIYKEIQTVDKTEEGFYTAIKNGTISPSTIAELSKSNEYKELIRKANDKILQNAAFSKTDGASSLLKKSPEELKNYILGLYDSFGLNKNYEEELNSNSDIQKYKTLYIDKTEEYLKKTASLENLRNSIRAKYPGATEGFINALYQREASAIIDEANLLKNEAISAKGGYDLILGEIDRNNQLQIAQSQNQMLSFNNIFNTQLNEAVKEEDMKRQLKIIQADKTTASEYSLNNLGNGIAISYNKTNGKYDIININNLPKGVDTKLVDGTVISDNGLDFSTSSDIINKYKGEASFKNNNPAGISSNASNELMQMYTNAGIGWSIGSERPSNEGLNYLKFDTIVDGLKAYEIALTKRGDSNVFNRLKSWVGTGNDKTDTQYAQDILNNAGISGYRQHTITWDNITEEEKGRIMIEQMKKESPGMYKELLKRKAISETGKIDLDALKSGGNNTKIINEKINGTDVILGGLGVPISYERTIKSQIPTQLLNSDRELSAANEVIKKMYEAGITDPGEASAVFQGFDITNEEGIKFGASLLGWTRGLINKSDGLLSNISQSVNVNKFDTAVTLLEDNYYNSLKSIEGDRLYTRNQAQEDISRINDLKDYINSLGEKYPGIIGGTFENMMGILKDTDIAVLKGKMARLNTKEKVDLFGTNQTEVESGSFNPLEFLSNDKLLTLLGKINNKENDILIKLNAYRNGRMPALNANQLASGINGVIEAYKGDGGNLLDEFDKIYNGTDSSASIEYDSIIDEY